MINCMIDDRLILVWRRKKTPHKRTSVIGSACSKTRTNFKLSVIVWKRTRIRKWAPDNIQKAIKPAEHQPHWQPTASTRKDLSHSTNNVNGIAHHALYSSPLHVEMRVSRLQPGGWTILNIDDLHLIFVHLICYIIYRKELVTCKNLWLSHSRLTLIG